LTFGIKLMEKMEDIAHAEYLALAEQVPDVMKIAEDEDLHEKALIDLIEEEKLKYVGSVVLGLNDALVELTGALAGLTFALQNTRLIALAGLITGIAASFSMAASEYLSKKHEGEGEDALKSSFYTGLAYIVTVAMLILPYLIFENYLICLVLTLSIALLIIFIFNYYVSVAMDMPFKRRFFEMAGISLGVSLFSFGIGWVIRGVLGVEI
ncbi:MAG: VIT1/CCC1 transporter family protein, partial [Spirochaetota bacterium]|nr:VIT1/CCC1 transporter family protein [Spirochaetota bacterium]